MVFFGNVASYFFPNIGMMGSIVDPNQAPCWYFDRLHVGINDILVGGFKDFFDFPFHIWDI